MGGMRVGLWEPSTAFPASLPQVPAHRRGDFLLLWKTHSPSLPPASPEARILSLAPNNPGATGTGDPHP